MQGLLEKGKQVIKTNETLALGNILELMQREWSAEQAVPYRKYNTGADDGYSFHTNKTR